ncbi:MAG: hypothetical protein QXE37_05225, partial [Nitrososphaerales archaeon]
SFEGELELSKQDFLKGCIEANLFIIRNNRVPSSVKSSGREIGIGSFLRALAEVFLMIKEGKIPEKITIREASPYPAIANVLSLPHYEDTWLYPPGFKGENIIKLAKLQTWSAKPAI